MGEPSTGQLIPFSALHTITLSTNELMWVALRPLLDTRWTDLLFVFLFNTGVSDFSVVDSFCTRDPEEVKVKFDV